MSEYTTWHVYSLLFFIHNNRTPISSSSLSNEIRVISVIFFFCGPAAPRSLRPHHSWGFYITHNDAPQSVGLLWTSDQLVPETSTWQHTPLIRDRHPCSWQHSKPQSQQASDRRPTPLTARPLGPAISVDTEVKFSGMATESVNLQKTREICCRIILLANVWLLYGVTIKERDTFNVI